MLGETDFLGEAPGNAAETKIRDLDLKPNRVFCFLFDLGDNWWHEMTAEQINAERENGKYPRILERHGKSPPQYPENADENEDEEADLDEAGEEDEEDEQEE